MSFNTFDHALFVNEINARLGMASAHRKALSLHKIVQLFKFHVDNQVLVLYDDLVEKIKLFSEEKIDYYRTSLFGFLIEFFSALRNLITLSFFKSSGQLGLEYAEQFLNAHPMNVRDILAFIKREKDEKLQLEEKANVIE